MTCSIMWFRRDLRLADNAALQSALAGARTVIPALVVPAAADSGWGPASVAWLRLSATSLSASLRDRGSELVMISGSADTALAALAAECGASRVHCQRVWTPVGRAEENAVARSLAARGIQLTVEEGQYLVAPDAISTDQGGPYRVFTPYWRRWRGSWGQRAPLPPPGRIPGEPRGAAGGIWPDAELAGGHEVARWWTPGEAGAATRLNDFVTKSLADYARTRDLPAVHGSSELSAHLAFGELSPRQVVESVLAASSDEVAESFVRQLAWREFAGHVLHHYPSTLSEPLRPEFSAFPWGDDPASLEAWESGRTGYPLVDAGMRQLAATGWMHNRVRLVCGSFLAKDLLVPWQAGAAHFERMLVDLDPASNAFNWQWVAGCGADAAPYFRVFNPTLQGTRFDPDGTYVRRWVPELEGLPERWVHRPGSAPDAVLAAAGLELGRTYPHEIVDHPEARRRALSAYAAIKSHG